MRPGCSSSCTATARERNPIFVFDGDLVKSMFVACSLALRLGRDETSLVA